ncbi:MAG: cell wall-binding repeat-containing protein [Clostridioides sp.]|nr:cell wall-binding repeat-containing protein [Clostridioides sp.]
MISKKINKRISQDKTSRDGRTISKRINKFISTIIAVIFVISTTISIFADQKEDVEIEASMGVNVDVRVPDGFEVELDFGSFEGAVSSNQPIYEVIIGSDGTRSLSAEDLNYSGQPPGKHTIVVQFGASLNIDLVKGKSIKETVKFANEYKNNTLVYNKTVKYNSSKPDSDYDYKFDDNSFVIDEIKYNTKITFRENSSSGGGTIDDGSTSETVLVIGCGDSYSDVLVASVLANEKSAPILLTKSDSIDAVTIAEIQRLRPTKIIICGGPVAVSKKVESQLSLYTDTIIRIGGADRYETAKLIADEVRKLSPNKTGVALVVGTDFPDAITISPLAIQNREPILLTETNSLNPTTKQAMSDYKISEVVIGGGEKAVSKQIENQLKNDLKISSVTRIGGEDRYDTARLVGEKLISITGNTKDVMLACGTNFPDALIISTLAGYYKAPVLLTEPQSLNGVTRDTLKTWKTQNVTIAGGEVAVSASVENELKDTYNVTRIAGVDRYDTAVKASQKLSELKAISNRGIRGLIKSIVEFIEDLF